MKKFLVVSTIIGLIELGLIVYFLRELVQKLANF